MAGFDEPVRMHDDRLMHQLEAGFRLADGFDRKRPHVHRLIAAKLDVDAQPFVGEAQVIDRFQIEPRAELAERIAVGVVEVAVVAAGGQAGEVELDAEVDRLAGRQTFEQVRNFERLPARFEREALGDSHLPTGDVAVARELHLHAVRIAAQPGFERRGRRNRPALRTGRRRPTRRRHSRRRNDRAGSCGDGDRIAAAGRDPSA